MRHLHRWATQAQCDMYNTLCVPFRQESIRIREHLILDLSMDLDALILEIERRLEEREGGI